MKVIIAWVAVLVVSLMAIVLALGPLGPILNLSEPSIVAYRQSFISAAIEWLLVGLIGSQVLRKWSKIQQEKRENLAFAEKQKRADLALEVMIRRVVDVVDPGTEALPWYGLETHSNWTIASHMNTPEEISIDKPFEWEDNGRPTGEIVSIKIAQRLVGRADSLRQTLGAMLSMHQEEVVDVVESRAKAAVGQGRLDLKAGDWRSELNRALFEFVEAADRAASFLILLEEILRERSPSNHHYAGEVGPEKRHGQLQTYWYALNLKFEQSERLCYVKFSSLPDEKIFELFGDHVGWGRPDPYAIIRQPLSQMFGRLHHILWILNEVQNETQRMVLQESITTVVLGVFCPRDPIQVGLR